MLLNIIFRCQEILAYFHSCDLEKITRFTQKKALKVQILNEVALRQVVGKWVRF